MNSEQHGVFDKVMAAVASNSGGMFFVYGYVGTDNTFFWKTLSAALRSQGDIILNVTSSGIVTFVTRGPHDVLSF